MKTESLYLVKAGLAYEDDIQAYKEACLADDPDGIHGAHGLEEKSVRDWLAGLALREKEETCPPGYVPDSTYLCYREDDKVLVGIINIRHRLNEGLLEHGGHIGYAIHPAFRNRGYAKEQLRLALQICRDKLGLKRVLLTCNADNPASQAVITRLGGVYEDSRLDPDNKETQRYWIQLT